MLRSMNCQDKETHKHSQLGVLAGCFAACATSSLSRAIKVKIKKYYLPPHKIYTEHHSPSEGKTFVGVKEEKNGK